MTMSFDERFEAFLRTKVPSFSGVFLDCLSVEDEATTILQNVWNHSCNDTASHCTRHECAKLLQEPQLSQYILLFYQI
jgi:hypothetical protein